MVGEVLFGFTHVSGVPLCPCKDPGNYLSLVCVDTSKPLECKLTCWCGRSAKVVFTSLMERAEFIEKKGY